MKEQLYEQLSQLPEGLRQGIAQALALPDDERQNLAEKLQQPDPDDMSPELKEKWFKILNERRKAYKEGRSKTYTKEEFMKTLRERLDARIRESADL